VRFPYSEQRKKKEGYGNSWTLLIVAGGVIAVATATTVATTTVATASIARGVLIAVAGGTTAGSYYTFCSRSPP